MKKIFVAIVGIMLMSGCSAFTENRESRSTVYEGQTTWDLYENFGAPTRVLKIGPNEYQFYYHKEAITRDWTRLYYDYCDTVFVIVDDRVVDWDQTGNQCYIYEAEGIRDTSGRLSEPEDEVVIEEEEYVAEESVDGKEMTKHETFAEGDVSSQDKHDDPTLF